MKKFIITVAAISLIAAACNKQTAVNNDQNQNNNNQTPSGQTYENSYLKLTLADGWTATAPSSNPAAVNIRNGNYILYINTQATQASGVEGGRFAEIAQGAPSADAVVTVQPSQPCGTSESNNLTVSGANHSRVDFYVDSNEKDSYCAKPTNGANVWYFSYVTGTGSNAGYFNYYTAGQNKALVITMSYNSKTVNSFPVKGSAELNSKLSEMSSIIQSLEIKQK